MGLIEALREIVQEDDCRALSFTCKKSMVWWIVAIGRAAEESGCVYTVLRDPENGEYAVNVTGGLPQLRDCVARLEVMRRDR